MIIVIRDNERGLVYRNGRLVGMLGAGRHRVFTMFAAVEVARINMDVPYVAATPEMLDVIPRKDAVPLDVPFGRVAAISVDGRPHALVEAGRYLLWQTRAEVTAELYDAHELLSSVPERFWAHVSTQTFRVVNVATFEQALLYVDGTLEQVLSGGRYLVSQLDRSVEVYFVDRREQELQIVGQEVMTADKVTLRVNVIVTFRIADAVAATETVDELDRALYAETQMAARRFVAGNTIEQMLESRNEAAELMAADVRERASGWGAQVLRVELKDVILPGEMKTILNRVIEAQKQAEANVIFRREETAATRSLANTAKMLEQNPTLMRLKELEAYKEIAGSIDNVTLVAGENLTRLLT